MPKITKYGGSDKPVISRDTCEGNSCIGVTVTVPEPEAETTADRAEVTEWDGSSSEPSSKRPAKSRRKNVPQIQSPARSTGPSSKQDPTDALFAGTVDGPETEIDYLNS